MLRYLKNKIKVIGQNLMSLDNKPIGKAALTVVIFLDLFILISIFDGLSDHTRQLTTPEEHIPQHCRDIVIEGDWNEANRLARIAQLISSYRSSYYRTDNQARKIQKYPICDSIMGLIYSMEDDNGFSENLSAYLKIRRDASDAKSELERVSSAYNTAMLEAVAKGNEQVASSDSLSKEVAEKTELLDQLVNKQQLLELSLNQDKRLQELFSYTGNIPDVDRKLLLEELRTRNFWYPLQRLGMEMIFLLPLFAIFYFWNAKSIPANRPLPSLVSTHLMIVVFIPVLFKIAELIYDIIPHRLLKRVIVLLESLNLVALWHYLSMFLAVVFALFLIYIFQKKLFSHEKLVAKRIAKSLCQACGVHLRDASPVCSLCGFNQYKVCTHCHQKTYVYGKYCRECGAPS